MEKRTNAVEVADLKIEDKNIVIKISKDGLTDTVTLSNVKVESFRVFKNPPTIENPTGEGVQLDVRFSAMNAVVDVPAGRVERRERKEVLENFEIRRRDGQKGNNP